MLLLIMQHYDADDQSHGNVERAKSLSQPFIAHVEALIGPSPSTAVEMITAE